MGLSINQFAETSNSSGISSLGINLKSFIFQLVTFLIVLFILRRWVFPKMVATLEARRQALEDSLANAQQTQKALAEAKAKAEEVLSRARAQADEALAEAKDAAAGIVAKAETAAGERAQLIIREAESRLDEEREKLRAELRSELTNLVADATEKIIHEKLDEKRDMSLIERAIKGIAG